MSAHPRGHRGGGVGKDCMLAGGLEGWQGADLPATRARDGHPEVAQDITHPRRRERPNGQSTIEILAVIGRCVSICGVRYAVDDRSDIARRPPFQVSADLHTDVAVGDEIRRERSLREQRAVVHLQLLEPDWNLVLADPDAK